MYLKLLCLYRTTKVFLSMGDGDDDDSKFRELMNEYTCNPSCEFTEAWEACQSFKAMNQIERINLVRGMLLSVSSPPTRVNEFKNYHGRRNRYRRSGEDVSRTTIVYGFQGRRLCSKAFSAITNICEKTIRMHAQQVSSSTEVTYYASQRCK